MNGVDLKDYGLSGRFEQEAALYGGLYLARVCEQHRELYKVICEQGELAASVSGKMLFAAAGLWIFPPWATG